VKETLGFGFGKQQQLLPKKFRLSGPDVGDSSIHDLTPM